MWEGSSHSIADIIQLDQKLDCLVSPNLALDFIFDTFKSVLVRPLEKYLPVFLWLVMSLRPNSISQLLWPAHCKWLLLPTWHTSTLRPEKSSFTWVGGPQFYATILLCLWLQQLLFLDFWSWRDLPFLLANIAGFRKKLLVWSQPTNLLTRG